jgi:FkbM family methyltransferase
LPDAFKALSRRAAKDPGWIVRNHALGAEDGVATINIAANEGASSSLLDMLPRHEEVAPDAGYLGTLDVPIRRLDSIWDEVVGNAGAVFLKADVQGFEGLVLDGAGDRLSQVTGFQLEISLAPLYVGAPTLEETLVRANDLGMMLVGVDPVFEYPRTREVIQIDALFMRRKA